MRAESAGAWLILLLSGFLVTGHVQDLTYRHGFWRAIAEHPPEQSRPAEGLARQRNLSNERGLTPAPNLVSSEVRRVVGSCDAAALSVAAVAWAAAH